MNLRIPPPFCMLLLCVALVSLSCQSKPKRATAGIADEYGMLSVEPKKEDWKKKEKERFDLRSIGESVDSIIPEW